MGSVLRPALLAAVLWLAALGAAAAVPPSVTGVDAPELARLGPYKVGLRSVVLVDPDQPDLSPAAGPGAAGRGAAAPRTLPVDIWYPARPARGARPVVYADTMSSEQLGRVAAFTVPGIAVRSAPADRSGPFPLVILSHGQSGTPAAMTWLAENLASKGYVVAAAHHRDPAYTDRARAGESSVRRPLDIAFVAHALQVRAAGRDRFLAGLADPARVALAGYSMGGYGVLTVAGAGLDPAAPAVQRAGNGALLPYARGGPKAAGLAVAGLKAVVAIAPAGGGAWGPVGVADLAVPLLISVGDQDKVVGFAAVKAVYEAAVHSPRYLLVFQGAGHSIGMNGAPPQMRSKLWDIDWFEDPVWRRERLIAVQLHMITAFLDRYVKGDVSKAAYLDVAVPLSNDTAWTPPPAVYGTYSPGTAAMTVWKGFQRIHIAGLELHRAAAAP